MVQVVDGPRGEQLLERDRAEVGVTTDPDQLVVPQMQLVQPDEVRGPELGEAVEHSADVPPREPLESGLTVDRPEDLLGPVLQDRRDAPEPVSFLDVREVGERLPRSPGPRPLVRLQPRVRQAAERRAEGRGRPGQQLTALLEVERHDPNSRSALAAKTKSASFSPSILWVHTVSRTLPHARWISGW